MRNAIKFNLGASKAIKLSYFYTKYFPVLDGISSEDGHVVLIRFVELWRARKCMVGDETVTPNARFF